MSKSKYIAAAIIAAAILVGLVLFNWFTGLLTTAPQIDIAEVTTFHPGVRIQINTAPIEEQILRQAAEADDAPPGFVLRALLPHGFSFWMAPDFTSNQIDLRAMVQEKRGGPLLARMLNRDGAYAEIEQFAFDTAGFKMPQRGALTLDGWFPIEQHSGNELADTFGRNPNPALTEMDGDHVFELRADNRNGAAYIVLASLLYAFQIDLSEQEEKISLTSFKFVDQVTLTANLVMDDSIGIVCEMDIEPGQRDKMAIVNLKTGLEGLLERYAETLRRDHDITLTGQTTWRENTLIFTYRLDDLPRLLSALKIP